MVRFSLSLAFWYFLLGLVVWRQICKFDVVQRYLHRICRGYLAPCLQWYTIYIIVVLSYMAYSIWEIMTQYWVPSMEIKVYEQLYVVYKNESKNEYKDFYDFRKPLEIPPWLKILNLVSLYAGLAVCVAVAYHAWTLLDSRKDTMRRHGIGWKRYPWKVSARMNWLLLILSMPVMYAASSIRAQSRIWALATGKATGGLEKDWKHVEAYELSLYRQDLELGAVFQFASVYAFARLCSSFMVDNGLTKLTRSARELNARPSGEETDKIAVMLGEYKTIIQYACFLGVWAFVIVGVFRSVFAFGISEALLYCQAERHNLAKLQHRGMEALTTVLAALAILCVVNMAIICNMQVIQRPLGNPNMKFFGTRALLIAGEVQSRLIDAFTTDKALYQTARQYVQVFDQFTVSLSRWKFSIVQARLFHLSLLNLECLCVVVFNFIAWSTQVEDLESSGILAPDSHQTVFPVDAEDTEADSSDEDSRLDESIDGDASSFRGFSESSEGSQATSDSEADTHTSWFGACRR